MIAVRIKLTEAQQEALRPIMQLLREKFSENPTESLEERHATVGQLDIFSLDGDPVSAWFTVLEPKRILRTYNAMRPQHGETPMRIVRDMMDDDVFDVVVGGDIWEVDGAGVKP